MKTAKPSLEDHETHDVIQGMLNESFALGEKAGYIKNLNPVKEAEIAQLKTRIKELEDQAAIVGHKNPAWEAGYQRALYIMPDEIARCVADIRPTEHEEDIPHAQLKMLYDIVYGVMCGAITNKKG